MRNTLRANRCDVIMGYAQGDELVQNTNAYYRSTYVLVYPKGSDIEGLDLLPADFSYRHMDIALDQSKKPLKGVARVLDPLGEHTTS